MAAWPCWPWRDAASRDAKAPSRETFEAALAHLPRRRPRPAVPGMYDWPIDLTEAEAGARCAPCRAAAGVREAGPGEEHGGAGAQEHREPGRRHQALRADRRRPQVLQGRTRTRAATAARTRTISASRRISLAKVEGWQLDTRDAQHPAATVSYSYRIEPAPWLQHPDAQRVLPMVAKVIKGADGGLQMHQGFTLSRKGWVAVARPGVTAWRASSASRRSSATG